jgi:SAM-dependent methyltransferase
MPRIQPFEKHHDQYEAWFAENRLAYESEVQAIRALWPANAHGVEIGVGSGLFAAPLAIKVGVEPSARMREKASERGITVLEGTAEAIPLDDWQFDAVLMVTTICFVDDVEVAFREVRRILKLGGQFIVGFVDADSPIGKLYQQYKDQDVFYRDATFYNVSQVIDYLERTGFYNLCFKQTLFTPLESITAIEPVRDGYGEGSFVVVRADR